jgi:hypothetical protein
VTHSGTGGLLGGFSPQRELAFKQVAQVVRAFMRDHAELNRLTQGVEHSDRLICWAIADAIDDWNTTPPLIGPVDIYNFPSKRLLIRATVINLLESVGLLMTRNHLTFSDGGVQVGISDKTPLIQSWIQMFKNDYESKKLRLKVAMNIENAWGGGVSSEYAWINGFWGGW